MKFKRWAAGIAALLLILSMGLISCAKPAGGTPEDNPVPQEEEEEEEIVSYKFGFSCISMEIHITRRWKHPSGRPSRNQAVP